MNKNTVQPFIEEFGISLTGLPNTGQLAYRPSIWLVWEFYTNNKTLIQAISAGNWVTLIPAEMAGMRIWENTLTQEAGMRGTTKYKGRIESKQSYNTQLRNEYFAPRGLCYKTNYSVFTEKWPYYGEIVVIVFWPWWFQCIFIYVHIINCRSCILTVIYSPYLEYSYMHTYFGEMHFSLVTVISS